MRMENELAKETAGSYNIKTGRGGMVDVEFVVQYLQLDMAAAIPELRTTSTIVALKEIRTLGLLPDDGAETLLTATSFCANWKTACASSMIIR